MRDIIIYALIVLLCNVESRTFCDDQRCVCVKYDNSLRVTCSSPTVFEANDIPDNITTLNLSRSNVTRLRRPFVSDSLIELLLVGNRLEEIPTDTLQLASLKILDLSNNNLEFIHRDVFAHIIKLDYLNLAHNKFGAFGSLNFFHLKSLREIVLDDNDIGPSLLNRSLFSQGYELTNAIQSISLKNVNLSDSKHHFMEAKSSIKKLNLAQNRLTQIPDLPLNLEYLDLSSNPIKNISRDDFFDVVYLSELKLNNLLIEEVPNLAFHYLTSLRYLQLEGNIYLKKFSPISWGHIILKDQIDLFVESLSFRGSNLTSLDGRMEGIFKKIRKVDLRGNPWECDCKLAWLQIIPIPEELSDFRCSSPQNLLNKRVLEVNSAEFLCKTKKTSEDYLSAVGIAAYCVLLAAAVLTMYFFIFSPKPFIYRQLPVEFPSTP